VHYQVTNAVTTRKLGDTSHTIS